MEPTKDVKPPLQESKGHSSSDSSQVDFGTQMNLSDTGKTQTDDQWLEYFEEHFATEVDIGLLPKTGVPLIAEAIVSEYPYRILEANSSFLMTLGFKPIEVIQTLRIIKGPETDDSKLTRVIQKAIDDFSSDENIVLYRKDGEELTCVVRGQPIMYDSQPACKLCILPYSFDSPEVNSAERSIGECILQCRRAAPAAHRTVALEHYRICGGSVSFRDLLGFRRDDAVQVW